MSSTGDALANVTTELPSDAGDVLDEVSTDVSGASASGSHELESRDAAAAVRLTVIDEGGKETVESDSV